MDALLILALGSLALMAIFATPVLADHIHEVHRGLRFSAVDAPRPNAGPRETPSPEPAESDAVDSPSAVELHDGDGQPSDYVGNTGDEVTAEAPTEHSHAA